MAYWTTSDEDKLVYHIYEDCSEGEKIEEKNREDGDPPANRELCEICQKRRGY
jgi:hypothetical protein